MKTKNYIDYRYNNYFILTTSIFWFSYSKKKKPHKQVNEYINNSKMLSLNHSRNHNKIKASLNLMKSVVKPL